jgi:hypothetical protein
MDRPEWIAANPTAKGEVYCTLTNNSTRGVGSGPAVDEANPRANNRYGHIIRWREAGGDTAATTFEWDIFVMGGDPTIAANTPASGQTGSANVNRDNFFGSPDGLWFDKAGRLWIQTDISTSALGQGNGLGGYVNMPNNMMLAANTVTGEIKRFLTGPKGCEITGISETPDGRTMFINIQHPGEGAGDNSNPADKTYPIAVSQWPGNQGHGFGASAPQAKSQVMRWPPRRSMRFGGVAAFAFFAPPLALSSDRASGRFGVAPGGGGSLVVLAGAAASPTCSSKNASTGNTPIRCSSAYNMSVMTARRSFTASTGNARSSAINRGTMTANSSTPITGHSVASYANSARRISPSARSTGCTAYS